MAAEHPNLLFVFPDQMRGSALGFLGEEPVLTPHLNQFAEQALVFTQAVANYPVCSPCRAMLMTGTYPHSNGVVGNCNSRTAPYDVELRAQARCWSDVLADQGYSLGYIGKWHLDAPHSPYVDTANNQGEVKWNEWCPPDRRHGFEYWYAYGTYDVHTRPMYWSTDAARDAFHYVDQWGPEHEADRALAYLRNEGGQYRDPERPFALVVSMNPPHMPYDLVPERYLQDYQGADVEEWCARPSIPPAQSRWGAYYRQHIRNYYAMISGVDEQFGRILAGLEEQGLAEDTIVVFTSDHGNSLGMHEERSKPNPYEECMRVPLIIRWPGQIPPRHDELLFSAPDVYPTLLDLMGFDAHIPAEVEGTSHAAPARGAMARGAMVPRPTSQLYLNIPPDQPWRGSRGVRTLQYTLVLSREGDTEEGVLYDRAEDPHEVRNVAVEQPEVVQGLRVELEEWLRVTRDPWTELDS
jgi:arylsulfatase A-like enzyme